MDRTGERRRNWLLFWLVILTPVALFFALMLASGIVLLHAGDVASPSANASLTSRQIGL